MENNSQPFELIERIEPIEPQKLLKHPKPLQHQKPPPNSSTNTSMHWKNCSTLHHYLTLVHTDQARLNYDWVQ